MLMDLRLWGSYSMLHQCDWRRIWVKWAWLMSSKSLTTFSSGEMNRNESDHVTQESERRCFGLLQHAIALKRQWIWLALRSKHTVPALFAHAQFSPHFLCLIVWKLQDTWRSWSDLFTVWKSAGVFEREHGMLGYRQCVGSMFTHVKCRSIAGSVGVRLRSEVICIAVDQPIGGQQASVQHWACQTPHRRIVWMFARRSALVWWFLTSRLFFLGLNYSWCHL